MVRVLPQCLAIPSVLVIYGGSAADQGAEHLSIEPALTFGRMDLYIDALSVL